VLEKLERLGKHEPKIKLRRDQNVASVNINRSDPSKFIELARKMVAEGKITEGDNIMDSIMKHEYMRKSMEHRVQRKALLDEFRKSSKSVL
jgi:hypothetical protein